MNITSRATKTLFFTFLALTLIIPIAGHLAAEESAAVNLTLLHNSNGESALLSANNLVEPGSGYPNTETVDLDVGGIAAFKTVTTAQIADALSQGNAVLNVYAGDAFLAGAVINCSLPPESGPLFDAVAQRQIPYTAHVFGNHEFDFNPDFTEDFIRTFDEGDGLHQPFLSGTLDFSDEPGFDDLTDNDGLVVEAPAGNRPVARAMLVTDPVSHETFGIVAATTYQLPMLSSPRNVKVTADLTTTAAAVQEDIDRLESLGINKVILVSHMHDLDTDRELVALLSGVDIAVIGGADELLTNPGIPIEDQLLPGEDQPVYDDYPIELTDKDGQTVYAITTRGSYKYLGRLDVSFDDAGKITAFDAGDSYPRRIIPDTAENASALAALGVSDAALPDAAMLSTVVAPLEACLEGFATSGVAFSAVPLDVSRSAVLSKESNAGNLITDSFLWAYRKLGLSSGVETVSSKSIAVTNGGGIRQEAGDSLEGFISRQDTMDVLPFPNDVVVIEQMTPAQILAVFEHAISEGTGVNRFLQISGVSVLFDLQQAPGNRVVRLTLADGSRIVDDGALVPGAPLLDLVTNSFTAGGGDGYTMLEPLEKIPLKEGGNLGYERAWVKFLSEDSDSFPPGGPDSLPQILPTDLRYRPQGEGRIRFVHRSLSPYISR